jgi:hypothetical protein
MHLDWTAPANVLGVVVFAPSWRDIPDAKNKTQQLPALLDHVLQGMMTAAEAAAHYGSAPRTGRPRVFPTFADYVEAQARHAESPETERALLALLTKVARHASTSQAKSAETQRVNRLLDETGSAYAARLRDLLADLAEPASN